MSKLKDSPLVFVIAVVFLLALWPVLVGNHRPRGDGEIPTAAAPDDLDGPQLLERLRAKNLTLHVTSAKRGTDDWRHGFFLSERRRDWNVLCSAPRDPALIDRWTGTVYVERRSRQKMSRDTLRRWGNIGCGRRLRVELAAYDTAQCLW
jgi:hypothetical protein